MFNLVLDQITRFQNLYRAWMGLLVKVKYKGPTKKLFRLDSVKFSSYDCPVKIPVDSKEFFFCLLVLVAGHPKL
jgi:hypothetical protein